MRPSPLAAGLVVVLALAACSTGSSSPASVAPAPTPTVSPTPTVPADFLTGLAPRDTGRPVAVKIDNAYLARPFQTGLGRAAVVYEELVEGGSTRFLAIYESDKGGAREVGPIRSVRESDVDLLREFANPAGGITVGFSGGNAGVTRIVNAAARKHLLVNASYDETPPSYRLGSFRKDARNFYVTPATLAAVKRGAPQQDIGLRFGVATGGLPTAHAVARYSPDSRVTLSWNASTSTWSVMQNDHLMPGVAPANVVVQRVAEHDSGFSDVHGKPTPYTVTTGGGTSVVLTGGNRTAGRWTRSGYGPTHFLDSAGHDVLLRPGPTWVLLVPQAGSLRFS